MQNVAGPTLVAVATTFGLGVDIHSPTGLSLVSDSVCRNRKTLLLFRPLIEFGDFCGDDRPLGCPQNGGIRFLIYPPNLPKSSINILAIANASCGLFL